MRKKFYKISVLILTIIIMVIPLAGMLGTENVNASDGFTYADRGTYIVITKYSGSSSSVTIPSSYNGKPVTEIGARTFYNNTSIKSVTIPSTVTVIGSGAFMKCTNLTDIIIPDSVVGMTDAFGWSGLENVYIGKNVKRISNQTFQSCEKLKKVTVANPNIIWGNGSESVGTINLSGTPNFTICAPAGSTSETFAKNNGFDFSVYSEGGDVPQPEKDADYSKVDAAIAKIPADLSKYTDSSAAAVTAAKNAVVRGKKASEQTVVDAMAKAIEDAVAALELKPVAAKKNGIFKNAVDGNYYYYVDDVIDTGKTGLVCNNDEWWYVKAGKVSTEYTGVINNGGGSWYVINGKIDINFSGLGKDGDVWRCVMKGKVYPEYTGLVQNAGYFWYVKDGVLDITYTGFFENAHGKWYVAAGKVDTNFTGLGKEGDKWLCVLSGKHNSSYTGLIKNGGEFWYVENGVLKVSFTGIVETGGFKWLVGTGKLREDFTGEYKDASGKTYNIIKGKVIAS